MKFELNTFLSDNREQVIAMYNELTNEQFFTGVSLKGFMMDVQRRMKFQNPKSEKRAASLLPGVLGRAYCDFCSIGGTERQVRTNVLESSVNQLPSL
jgi:hypothetical protein